MPNKLFVKTFLTIFLLGFSGILLFNYLSDPIQYYHYSPKTPLDPNERWQSAGFIRTYQYDQVILGTSMSQNFSLETIKQKLGTNPIKLAISGLDVQDQALVLKSAIQTGKVKSVIWGIDRGYLHYDPNHKDATFPTALYHQDFLAHFTYLININTTLSSLKNLSLKILKPSIHPNLEEYKMWHKDANFSKQAILNLYNDSFAKIKMDPNKPIKFIPKNELSKNTQEEMKNLVQSFEKIVLPVVRENPNIQFNIFFPPCSLAFYKYMYTINPEMYQATAAARKKMIEMLNMEPNVSFYDFETSVDIISDLNNYKDMMHYSKKINDHIIDTFRDPKNRITLKNLNKNHQAYLLLPEKSFK